MRRSTGLWEALARRATTSVIAGATAFVAVAVGSSPAPAQQARIDTWSSPGISQSPHVDPTQAPGGAYMPPPGEPRRPPALRLQLYVPAGYRSNDRKRYPVLYLLGGYGDSFDSWAHARRGRLLEVLPDFPGFIVMPESDSGWFTNWWNGGRYGDPQWERYHLDQLIPYMESRLRIRRGRRWHAIAGLSQGAGLGAMNYAALRPGYFGAAAGFSGVYNVTRPTYYAIPYLTGAPMAQVWGDPDAQEFYWRGHSSVELADALRHTRLFVTVGDGTGEGDDGPDPFSALFEVELADQAREFVARARAVGAPATYEPRPGVHAWRYWREDLRRAARWDFFAPPPTPSDRWTYKTVAEDGEMWGLRFRFHAPPREIVQFTREGSRLRAQGSGRVTLARGSRCSVEADLPFERDLSPACWGEERRR